MNSIADSKLYKELRFGACNRAKNKFTQFGGRFTIGALKQFAELYDKKQAQAQAQAQGQTKTKTSRLSRRAKTSSRSTKKNSRTTHVPTVAKSRSL
jgi:hypothetical protein